MWPLIERELRVALRRKAPRHRWYVALGAGGVSLFFLILSLPGNSSTVGRDLSRILLWGGLYVSVVQVMQTSTDAFSEERRNRTLSLLFLAGLTPLEIFVSKLIGRLVYVLGNLLALLPFLALPFLAGGISLACFIASNVLLFNLLLFTLSIAVLASVLCEDDGAAFATTLILGLLIVALPPALWFAVNHFSGSSLNGTVLVLSPGYAARLVFIGLPPAVSGQFWACTALTFAYSLLALVTASVVLCNTWQDERSGILPLWLRSWLTRDISRNTARTNWLESKTFGWLIVRDKVIVRIVGCILIVIGAVWLVCAVLWRQAWVTPMNGFATAVLLNLIVTTAVGVAAARRFGQDRRNGALELLLTTPLSVPEIVGDYHTALRVQFRPLVRALCLSSALLALLPLVTRPWNVPGLITYAIVWCFIAVWAWRGLFASAPLPMWVSLNTGRPLHSVLRSINLGWGWIWLGYNLFRMRGIGNGFPHGTIVELIIVALVVGIVLLLMAGNEGKRSKYEALLVENFREISAYPPPAPTDPELKRWDMQGPFPSFQAVVGPSGPRA